MIIDVHTHIGKLPHSKFSESYEKNLHALLQEMDGSKINTSFILAGFENKDGFNISTKSLVALTAGLKNIRVIGSLDVPNYKEQDLKELEGWIIQKSIIAIKLYTGYQHFYPSDERCFPIYELCQRHDIPVIFHSGDTLAGCVPNPKLRYSHPLHIDDVAVDWPNLKIVIAHMGNPWQVDAAEVLYKNPNVYADISGLVVGDDLATPYGEMMKSKIQELITYAGTEHKLLYGTDWPLCPMGSYLKFAENLGFSGEQRDRLFYKNALAIFKI